MGHEALPRLGRETAAVLACGSRAVLSHRSAAGVWELDDLPAGTVEVTVPGACRRSRKGIAIHSARLDPVDVATRAGLPVTTPSRLVLDLASRLETRALERLVNEVGVRRLATLAQIRAALDRGGTRSGVAHLRGLLDRLDGPRLLRSEAEARMLDLIRRSDLPIPATNARLGRHEVDFLWRAQRLAAEVDGFAFHSSRQAFERDRIRDADLQAAGYRVVRITWRRIVDEPEATVAQLAVLLAAGAPA